MLCGNKNQQRYTIGNMIGNKAYECVHAKGKFDTTQVLTQKLQVRFLDNQNSIELFNLVNKTKIQNFGTVTNLVSKHVGVQTGSYFIITKPLGPTLSQALRQNLLTPSDKLKVAIELTQKIFLIHENNFLLNHVCPDNINFSKDIKEGLRGKNTIVISSFENASKKLPEGDILRQASDISLVASLLQVLGHGDYVTEFLKEIGSLKKPDYSKLIFLLKLQILLETPDHYFSWESRPERPDIYYEDPLLECDEREVIERPRNHATVLNLNEIFDN